MRGGCVLSQAPLGAGQKVSLFGIGPWGNAYGWNPCSGWQGVWRDNSIWSNYYGCGYGFGFGR